MNPEIVNKVDAVLNAIAAKIGVGIDHFYPILVNQQYINGAFWLVGFIIGLVLVFIGARLVKKYHNNEYDYFGNAIFGGFMTVIFSGLSLGFLYKTIICLFNPEYAVITNILKLISGN